MSSPWQIHLLGGLRVQRGPVVITRFRSHRFGALLAYLALFPQRLHTREALADLLWPDADLEAGRVNLRTALSSLRRQLEPPDVPPGSVVVTKGNTYVELNPAAIITDVAEFEEAVSAAARAATADQRIEHLRNAVQRYTGPLLPGFYENWALNERERLAEAHLRAVQQLAALQEQAGEGDQALDLARRAVSADPFQEESHAIVIRLLMASGQFVAAQRQYEELARLLKERLDIEPSPYVRALLEAPRNAAPVPERQTPSRSENSTSSPEITNRSQPVAVQSAGKPTSDRVPVNVAPQKLPRFASRFFGREEEIAALQDRLLTLPTRLITLTGPGGSGKTRVAVETARNLSSAFRGGIWYMPLADITDAERIPETIAEVLGISRRAATTDALLGQIATTLQNYTVTESETIPALLILDNFEQLAEEGAEIVADLLERVPTLHCLVTSRQRLRIAEEREFPLLPLPVPGYPGTPERLLEFSSVQLFVSRAQEIRSDFQMNARNASSVAALCAKLEGIPLAIELAAALSGVLTAAQILQRMEKRLDLLVSRRRDIAPRHRTLRAAMESSVTLLPPPIRSFFAALSVFRGSWSLEAAEAIFGESCVLDYMMVLRDHSLVVDLSNEETEAVRFRMLETLREFAAEMWVEEATDSPWRDVEERHAAFFSRLIEEGVSQLSGPGQTEWLRRLEVDHDNIRAVLDRRSQTGDIEEALRLAGMLTGFWSSRGHLSEGRQRLVALLDQPGEVSPLVRARALSGLGKLAYLQSDYAAARRSQDACLEIYRAANHAEGIARTLCELGNCEMLHSNYAAATTFCEESLAGYRALNDTRGIALLLNNLGAISLAKGLPQVARPYLEESLPLSRAIGHHRNVAITLFNLATIWQAQGNFAQARSYYEQSLTVRQEQKDLGGMGHVLEGLARLAMEQGDTDEALRRFEESLLVRRQIQDRDGMASVLVYRGLTLLNQAQDQEGAFASLRESLEISQATGNKHFFASALDGFAALAAATNHPERAIRLRSAAATQRAAIGVTLKPEDAVAIEAELATLRTTVGTGTFNILWESGQRLTRDQAATLALEYLPTSALRVQERQLVH